MAEKEKEEVINIEREMRSCIDDERQLERFISPIRAYVTFSKQACVQAVLDNPQLEVNMPAT